MLGVWTRRGGAEAGGGAGLVERVLAARGLQGEAGREFLQPTLKLMHDPGLMPDIDRAAERLLRAARDGERIVIYGDYDVDGVSATAILFHTLKHLHPKCAIGTYVPHRLEEGYGLNEEAIRALAAEGAKVIVSVDCGITAVQPARAALECGIDLIVTDHHNPPASMADLPPAYAVVHPRRPDSVYPFGDLSGSAVAFKLAWRLATMACGGEKVGAATRELLLEMLGVASLGVIADVVPLRGENRVLARFGLAKLKHSTIVGLRALVEASGLSGESVGAYDVGFKLGPRLNACGRLGHAREAVELLTVAGGERAREIAEQLTKLNNDRRAVEKRIADQASELAKSSGMTGAGRRAIVLAHEEWHAGVVGIACSRLVGMYYRPTILMHRDPATGECHGSGRSIDGFNLHGALERCAKLLSGFGGHDMAAGVRVAHEKLPEFVEAFTEVANAQIAAESLCAKIEYDSAAKLEELSQTAVHELENLAPFGRENPAVRLKLESVQVEGRPKVIGQTGTHISMFVKHAQSGRVLRILGWSWAERIADLPVGSTIDVVIEPKISTWQGSGHVEAELVDLRVRSHHS